MATVITQPAAGAYIGPGMYIYLTVDGPTAFDDRILVTIATSTASLTSGVVEAHGATSFGVEMGWDTLGSVYLVPEPGQFVYAQAGAPLAAACEIQVAVLHSSGTVVSFTTFTGYFWDPVSGAPYLLHHLRTGQYFASDPKLDTILGYVEGGTFASPLIGVTHAQAYSGNPMHGAIVTDLTPPVAVAVLGLSWEAVATPAYIGRENGVIEDAHRRVIQLAVDHTLFGGVSFTDQTFESHGVTGTCWFDSPNPTLVSAYAAPGFDLNLSWLVVL